MKVKGLDGKIHSWPLKYAKGARQTSKLHAKVREFLKNKYPTYQILEEVKIPGSRLRLDFYIPGLKMAVECHGEQHYKYNSMFFSDKLSFYRAISRDKSKEQWCVDNGITLIILNFNESIDEWQAKFD